MLRHIIGFSIKNKVFVLLVTGLITGYGIFSVTQISIGAVPDITNNQVQIITTSQNLSTQDIEKFVTYPIEIEMANLPGVKEIRSVSKFGLSVVTIVFEESMGTYLPRQLIAEKIKTASEKIPEGFGIPEIGPISTGLGEIYQYILDVKPEYKDLYTVTDLRTIQDWIIKRQLSGIKGVVEINTWGGYLKQYEVTLDLSHINALHITTVDVFDALEQNNSIAGGAYIEKTNQSYFIRGEGQIKSIEDIRNIVVKNDNGNPIYIRDVAKVQEGHANRFGAITGNGEGEKVLGQIMMLKGSNSKKVIEEVKKRIAEIEKNLPKGMYINPFLERSELVSKTTFTVAENLILGCLIVIFIVVLLLGNFRSGMIIASVIPLCLLFAISFMNFFGIDANLMSLGAIDFGIIIDGSVIIVEFIAFTVASNTSYLTSLTKKEQQKALDRITISSTSKMMNSAIFGQIIIMIVFIPIVSLSGVEGKMFQPMALTFGFALLGAMLFCITYVPVISSLILKPKEENPKSFSKRLMSKLERSYIPILHWALQNTGKVLYGSLGLLVGSFVLFMTMGGEFIPKLDEGDFVIQPVLKTGTSLSKTIAVTTKIEHLLLKNFPEVLQVVSRIGAAEIPTDPMSMEESDIIVKLKPKKDWVSAKTKIELMAKVETVLSVLPHMEMEFTQPIEMRFNELLSGSRTDIAVKIFGEDLDVLHHKAMEVKKEVEKIPGASDVIVEKITGLPQMSVAYHRSKIARYGLNIADLNQMITLAFAGVTAGSIFEGEKRFDLVVRLDKEKRKNITDLENLYIPIPGGHQIPLTEVAQVTYSEGPAKIARDNTKRRVVVGINVRDRDLESVVKDIETLMETKIKLPVGYYVSYGGQFENLKSAKNRLFIAVPLALGLIFVLLYFAFHSIKEALVVYTAIPLAAVGGILFLWIRDLPFSISAGVGFIALFGIAVLNGIVLIEHFKELKHQGVEAIDLLIVKGTVDRLRPVLLTALAAALGFLPMALSTSAGAEVQRPLATVVIGGLCTATLLTLLVLPVLYKKIHLGNKKEDHKIGGTTLILFLMLIMPFLGVSQNKNPELQQFIQLALNHNKGLKAYELQLEKSERLIKSAYSFDKTTFYYNNDNNNLDLNNLPVRVFGVQQVFAFPTVYTAQKKVNRLEWQREQAAFEIQKSKLLLDISKQYEQLVYFNNQENLYRHLDSLYENFAKAGLRRFELGETNYLERITTEAKFRKIRTLLLQIIKEKQATYRVMQSLLQTTDTVVVRKRVLEPLVILDHDAIMSQYNDYFGSVTAFHESQLKLQRQHWLPDVHIEFFQGKTSKLNEYKGGFQLGLSIPLFFTGTLAKTKAATLEIQSWEEEQQNQRYKMDRFVEEKKKEIEQQQEHIVYYQKYGKQLAQEIIKTAMLSYTNGEIDFFQYIQSLESAMDIELDYLNSTLQNNKVTLDLYYLNY